MSFFDPKAAAQAKALKKAVKKQNKHNVWWDEKAIEELKKGTKQQFKKRFSNDESASELQTRLIALCDSTFILSGMEFGEIDLSKLRDSGLKKLVEYILESLQHELGIRPDTPWHENLEARYPADPEKLSRYMELNALGGGMRLVFDSETKNLFLTVHYALPALLVASEKPESLELAQIIVSLTATHQRMEQAMKPDAPLADLVKDDPLVRAFLESPENRHLFPHHSKKAESKEDEA